MTGVIAGLERLTTVTQAIQVAKVLLHRPQQPSNPSFGLLVRGPLWITKARPRWEGGKT